MAVLTGPLVAKRPKPVRPEDRERCRDPELLKQHLSLPERGWVRQNGVRLAAGCENASSVARRATVAATPGRPQDALIRRISMGVAWSGVGSVSASAPVVRQRHDKTARKARDARRAGGGKRGFCGIVTGQETPGPMALSTRKATLPARSGAALQGWRAKAGPKARPERRGRQRRDLWPARSVARRRYGPRHPGSPGRAWQSAFGPR